jgi:hypothetical protein
MLQSNTLCSAELNAHFSSPYDAKEILIKYLFMGDALTTDYANSEHEKERQSKGTSMPEETGQRSAATHPSEHKELSAYGK